jgi:AAA domain
VKLKQLTVAGFRGFNAVRTVDFSDTLTLVSAPNSHGKTSITEALEYLLHGETSKVASADSKEEYKDSYVNKHYPPSHVAFVQATFSDANGKDVVFRGEVTHDGIRRRVNGKPVQAWPCAAQIAKAARPFVVQHALKRLLLAKPADRFQGFAEVLGLQDVDQIQQALVNVCGKPDSHAPPECKKLIAELETFLNRLKSITTTMKVAKELAKGSLAIGEAYKKVHERGEELLNRTGVPGNEMSAALVDLRNAAASKVYDGSVAIKALDTSQQQRLSASEGRIDDATKAEFMERYARLGVLDASHRLHKEFKFLEIGIELATDVPDSCPFCEQQLTETMRYRAISRKSEIQGQIGQVPDLSTLRAQMSGSMEELGRALQIHSGLLAGRCADLIAANTPESSEKIKALFGEGHAHELFLVASAGAAIKATHKAIIDSAEKALSAIDVCKSAILQKSEVLAQVEAVVQGIGEYLVAVAAYLSKLDEVAPTLAESSRILRAAVDSQAGTAELSLLIEVIGSRSGIRRAVRLKETLEVVKALRKHVDQAVGQTMENAFSEELTDAVMAWYKEIRTIGDPDVHFSGFAMDKTLAGAFKNRRVKIDAKSYGVELASAVSSLSESKLNALGLCVSIATALRAPGPWNFLVLDDPIQSWDDEHEVQFIQIIRKLAEEQGKQIILLSHREQWVDQVADGCRSINGVRYHIGAYTKEGPVISLRDWAALDARLKEAWAIANDTTASTVRLQQGEEEIRLAACQLTAQVAKEKLGRETGAHKLNSDKCRAILVEAGCAMSLIDRVCATFTTSDDAHHAPKHYTASAQRIRHYHSTLSELKNWLESQRRQN